MVSERDRILKLAEYVESKGVQVNVGKNKAQGHKGFFKARGETFRIDIAKGMNYIETVRALAHEFAHFVHYSYDKTLKSLDFIFDMNDEILEELISLTVEILPKESVQPIFLQKESVKKELKDLQVSLRKISSVFNEKIPCKNIEDKIKRSKYRYLLKYDNVKVLEGFFIKKYSISELKGENELELYLMIKSKQRLLNRINSKISRLNKYYNSPSELFARAFETFVINPDQLKRISPRIYMLLKDAIDNNKIPLLNGFVQNVCLF